MTKKKSKKEKTQTEVINEEVLKEHKRLVEEIAKTDPNSKEYGDLIVKLEKLEGIQRKKEENQIKNKDSKRSHIGSTLINTGGAILTAGILSTVNIFVPMSGGVEKSFMSSIFRKR